MRTKTLLSMAIAGLLMVLGVSSGWADRVKTTKTTKVMKRPGEQSAVVTRVKAGRTLNVISTEGRWLKVRVNGRTGWIARSSVKEASAREVPRNTRRRPFVDGRSTRRGWSGGAPDDRVGGDAVDEDEAADEDEDEERPRKAKPAKKAKKAKARSRDRDEDDEDDEDFEDEDVAESDCEDDEDCEEVAAEEPKERVVQVAVAKTKLRSKRSTKGKGPKVKKGAKLVVLEEKGDWFYVADPDGEEGWIQTSEVWEPGMRKDRAFRVDARLGFERLSQLFASTGQGDLANYAVQSAAAAVSLRGDAVFKYGKNYLVGAELRYDLGKATPGIRYQSADAAADIGYMTHDIDARAVGGYDFHHKTGAVAWARLGYHYGMFAVDNVADFTQNLARLPSETLSGFTVGVGVELPRITPEIGGRLAADYLVMGKRAQTTGLEDGAVSTASAAWAGLVVTYQWKPDMTLDAAYGYEYAKTVWSGAAPGSMRGHAAESAARKDVTHGLFVGVAKSF